MILLIPRCEIILLCDKNIFKFHYDSINSMSSVDLSHPDAHLNSIMILLIQMQHHATLTYDINLNSIMILLIHHNTWV